MAILEGKSPAEKKKIGVAAILGLLALITLYYAFGGGLFGSGTGVRVTTTTPSPTRTPRSESRELTAVEMPSQNDQLFDYQTTPVVYQPGIYSAPDPGRNIFAFYIPPPPCRPGFDCPTPAPTVFVPQTPEPTPTPDMLITFVTPQSGIYAGGRGFRLEINGDQFTPDAKIYFSQRELPTTYINSQRLVADVPANFILGEGPRQVIVQTPDGTKYSNQVILNVQAPPKPQFQYVGMIARRLANNDTAVFREQGKPTEFSARLNDVVGGRFRLVSISAAEVIVEDTNLGFRHQLALFRPAPGTVINTGVPAGGFPQGRPSRRNQSGFPNVNEGVPSGSIPGIPDNIPRYVPPNAAPSPGQPRPTPAEQKQDVDDEDTDGDN